MRQLYNSQHYSQHVLPNVLRKTALYCVKLERYHLLVNGNNSKIPTNHKIIIIMFLLVYGKTAQNLLGRQETDIA